MAPFDYFVVIDWSARAVPSPARPTANAIWLAEGAATGAVQLHYFPTRAATTDYLAGRLRVLVGEGQRILVGWDFAFGYPEGLASALGLVDTPAWLAVWREIAARVEDGPDNQNNRFAVGAALNRRIGAAAGPFWGTPAASASAFLKMKKDFEYPVQVSGGIALPERRRVERRSPGMQAPWKLAYAGSVGGQSLLGIRRLLDLAFTDADLRAVSQVWPFTTAFTRHLPERGGLVLHAEIYPSLLPRPRRDEIADREQVLTYLAWLRGQQAAQTLAHWLAGPTDLCENERQSVLDHEGWVLGVA
ncbi:hypothetical protein QWY85_11585 [Neolewinella lacunae]|uniref:Cobalamin biosynthesis protein CbiG n=1 Tax=Neolewinella lacunae TaxID=1517758 RepID=A0A923TCK0_9BACT|nr:hypothetical protein [Neolewinella lacunae]MBC6993807.1 hypothetical protein [Neolewinella lacunae]MDN3635302.1 hypothetical protein [Neolewinella lacunae]